MTQTLSISKAREDLPSLVDKAQKNLAEYTITVNGSPAAVLMSYNEFESWKETIEILSDPQLMAAITDGEKDVRAGRVHDWEDVKKRLNIDV